MNKILRLLLLGIFVAILCGCLPTKYIARNYYLLNINSYGTNNAYNTKKPLLLVARTSIAPQNDQLYFLYRTNNNQFITDYYNGFLVSPADQLNIILIGYLKAHSKFYPVTPDVTTIPTIMVQTRIIEIYADYRDSCNPKAVLAIQFVATKQTAVGPIIIFDRTLQRAQPLCDKTTESLLAAWNQDLRSILSEATRAINGIQLPKKIPQKVDSPAQSVPAKPVDIKVKIHPK